MKIVQSIQNLYSSKLPFYRILQKKVDEIVQMRRKPSWHFIHRIKSPESFALKLETGRFSENEIFEDFFACTIVVENLNEITNAAELVQTLFYVLRKNPQSSNFTFKNSDSFPFDDLRMYCKLGDQFEGSLESSVTNLTFEVQIKTFLQHAWGIATHDIVYKTDKISWAKERVAFHVKAALEQAEVAISGADSLSKVKELNKENKIVKKINRIITIVSKHFDKADLPSDKRRLAQNIISLIDALDINIQFIEDVLTKETDLGRGSQTRNLSPFQIIVQSVYNQDPEVILKFLRKRKGLRYKLLVASEMNINNLKNISKKNIIQLP